MGLGQSHAEFFQLNQLDAQDPDDVVDPLMLLYRVERTLWRTEPEWLKPPPRSQRAVESSAPTEQPGDAATKPQSFISKAVAIDPTSPMTVAQALALVPSLMDERWVSPLVAIIDNMDGTVQAVGLALLATLVRSAAADEVFLRVGGVAKVMGLLELDSPNVRYLALEVIHALCSRNARIVTEFCDRGLIPHLARLTALDESDSTNTESILASLKILRHVLPQRQREQVSSTHDILPILLKLTQSARPAIANFAVINIGLSLSNPASMASVADLRCVDTLLKLVQPPVANLHAVIQALSLIADRDNGLFPKELTILTMSRTLDTLRGGAKRSKAASACAYLFASLARSDTLRGGLCTEGNLSILSKLLVGGSTEVLKAASFALGMSALEGSRVIRETIFSVNGPENLLKLLDDSADDELTRLVLFALGTILDSISDKIDESLTLPHIDSDQVDPLSNKAQHLAKSIVVVDRRYEIVLHYLNDKPTLASTYAAKIVCYSCSVEDDKISASLTKPLLVRLLGFLPVASDELLRCLLYFFVECSSPAPAVSGCFDGARFCELLDSVEGCVDSFTHLFSLHDPAQLAGLMTIFRHYASLNSSLRLQLSALRVIELVMTFLSRVSRPSLQRETLSFLVEITRLKNRAAIANIYSQSPDRVANLSYSPDHEVVSLSLEVLRRLFKYHDSPDIPAPGARRQLAKLLGAEDMRIAVSSARVWGNLMLHLDKRKSFAGMPDAVEMLLRLMRKNRDESSNSTPKSVVVKNSFIVTRALLRGVRECADMKKETACAPSFLVAFEYFDDSHQPIMVNAVGAMAEVAAVPALRRYAMVPFVLEKLADLLNERDVVVVSSSYRVEWLKFITVLCKRDDQVQKLLSEFGVVDAITLLVHSPASTLEMSVMKECFEALAWLCSKNLDVRKKVALSPKLIDLALRYIDCSIENVATACLHLLQRLTSADDSNDQKNKIRLSGGVAAIMRAIQSTSASADLKVRASALVRNLVTNNETNCAEFQRLGFIPIVLRFIAGTNKKLQLRGLEVVAALTRGLSSAAKTSKLETLECEYSQELVQIVHSTNPPKLLRAWCEAAVSLCHGSTRNQKKFVDSQLTMPIVRLVTYKAPLLPDLQIAAARLLACLASLPVNRDIMMAEGGDALLSTIIAGLQSEVHDVQRYVALLIAHITTRNAVSKVRIGAGSTASCLIDRLSSKQLNVVENVLQAIVKLGSHAGNKVKFGSRVCFEKLLGLVHDEELLIRKGAISAIAVLIEGNDANKKLLLQCEASVVTELCAMMKSPNGKIVESSMLILGELSQLPDQTLEISKYIDTVSIVRMIEHHNPRIRRAALHTVLNLTKESFNKLRFGIQECVDAMLTCLQSEDMLIVELATTSLANLSFLESNASKIATRHGSIGILLKLAAASTTSKDYLSWNEARLLGLGKGSSAAQTSPTGRATSSPPKQRSRDESSCGDFELAVEEDEIDDKLEPFVYSSKKEVSPEDPGCDVDDHRQVLDFSSFPARQSSVLEQTLLVVRNCAHALKVESLVERVAVKIICQALNHPSELVKRCACYILAVWCKKDTVSQRAATKQGILPVLIQLLSSPNVNVVESAIYLLGKLSYYDDNHVKLLQFDILTTLVQSVLRKPSNIGHAGLVDRAIRLLGTLVQFTRVRQTIKSEEIVADILTQLLQIHRSLAKNISRLILGMLEEDSLRFFLPKKTVMILRVILTDDHNTTPKTTRNILTIFQRIVSVEEHKTTIALEDSGEALTRMVLELCPVKNSDPGTGLRPELPPNSATVLSLLACLSSTRKIALILHEKDVYAMLPFYVMTTDSAVSGEEEETNGDPIVMVKQLFAPRPLVLDALLTARNMCSALGDRAGTRLSNANFSRLLIELLRALGSLEEFGKLPPEVRESFVVLGRLSMYSRDQQHLAEDYAVEVVCYYFQRWIQLVEDNGVNDGDQEYAGSGDLVSFVDPIVRVLLHLAENETNKVLLVDAGAIPRILQSVHVLLLTDELLLHLTRALRLVCALPVAVEWFDAHDVVTPLFRFMQSHRNHDDLRLLCLGCLADILENSVSSRRHVIGQPQVLQFLLECLKNPMDDRTDKTHYAINSLECMSMEPELASSMAELDKELLYLVPGLLLVPADSITRSTQYFAVEMIGYMASYGYGDKLGLQFDNIVKVVTFLDFVHDESITGEVIALTLWTLAHLVRGRSSNESSTPTALALNVCRWIATTENGIDLIVKAGLAPSEQLGTSSSVTANTMTILLAICTSIEPAVWVPGLIKSNRGICATLSSHLEAVEREINLPALRLLAICMATTGCDDLAEGTLPGECENWTKIFRHLMEWMEVYARDPERCPGPSLGDAFVCLSQITLVESLAGEFKACISRSGLAEIVGNAITYLDPKRQENDRGEAGKQDQERYQVLLNALKICGNLMACTTAYTERFFLLNVPQAIENVLMIDDNELIVESLVCMSWLADWSSTRQLLFSSLRSVSRLTELLGHKCLSIVAKVTPLLVLMCSRIPSLPGLCTVDGIQLLCNRLSTVSNWNDRDRYETRITEDCATILLSIFSPEETISVLFQEVDVVGKMFDIVGKSGAPEIPLRILTKISSNAQSHPRFLQLLEQICQLLHGSSQNLGGPAQHLALCILFNVFCRADDPEIVLRTLQIGEKPVLQQLLPLKRWIGVPNTASVRIAIKILHTYVSSTSFRGLLNDGGNVPALLKLISDTNDDVSAAAAQLLLTAISQREVEIAVTVEDGVAVLVRALQKTSKWRLQCLLLSILKSMCHDAEVPVLIMNEDGVSRLVHFVRERKGVLFAADERLALSCKVLRYVSAIAAPGAASRIVDSRGHARLVELATHQEGSTNDSERATTMEILSNLAMSGEVTAALVESKLHEYCLKTLLSQPSAGEHDSVPQSRKLALLCLRALCKHNKNIRVEISTNRPQLVDLLEGWLQSSHATTSETPSTSLLANAMATLKYLSKTLPGRHSIFTRTSPEFVQRVCENIIVDQARSIDMNRAPDSTCKIPKASLTSLGVKLLGNLLSDPTPERFRVKWTCGDLVRLLSLLQNLLSDHPRPKMQLHCLDVLCGSFDGGCYLSISAQMLSDLINIVLISPTPRHATQAEHVIIKAFEREQEIQLAIVGNQILEQLLIVFSQRAESKSTEPLQRRPLAPALTHVLNLSMTRGFLVNPRFMSKIITLLSTSPLALKAELSLRNGGSRFANHITMSIDDGDEDALVTALSVYLGFAHRSSFMLNCANRSDTASLHHTIHEALRAESNVSALAATISVVLSLHGEVCISGVADRQQSGEGVLSGRATVLGPREVTHRDLLLWSLLSHSLHAVNGESQPTHLVSLMQELPHDQWLCLLGDIFDRLGAIAAVANSKRASNSTNVTTVITPAEGQIMTLRILAVTAMCSQHPVRLEATDKRTSLCVSCLRSILFASRDDFKSHETAQLLEGALDAVSSIRLGWGEDVVVKSVTKFGDTQLLLSKWLRIFSDTNARLDPCRTTSLQVMLLLASSGSCTEDLKASGIRTAIENNELISAAQKSVVISILGLLGYNSDLNAEFQMAVERLSQAEAFTERKEALSYLTNFLQLYSLTDESSQEQAIDCCMRHLVEYINSIAREASQSKTGDSEAILACVRDYLVCLIKLSHDQNFVDLYMKHWNTNALLGVCFSRRRALNRRGFKECSVLNLQQISDGLDMCKKFSDLLSSATSAGTLSDTTFLNAMSLLDDLPLEQISLCERIVALLAWCADNEDTFDLLCNLAGRLRSVLRFVTLMSDTGFHSLTRLLDTLTKRVPQIELLGELLTELLTCVYRNAGKLKNVVRERLLLYILMILKRMGEDDLTACSIYEQSIQVILANVHVPAEMAARCSWDLLGVLSELDPAIVTIFNFDGIQIMLKEFCEPTSVSSSKASAPASPPIKRVLSTRKSALSASDRAALSAPSPASNEIVYRRFEALKCLSKAARNHDEVLQKIGGFPGIAAHLFRVIMGSGSGGMISESETSPAAINAAQEHATHLIARISSQELFRASLLSQDHITCLIESLESVHPRIVLYALEALFYLSEFAMCLEALVRHATVPVLAQILVSVENQEVLQQNTELFVLGLLANMCAKNKVIGRRVVSSNLLPRLRLFLASSQQRVQFYAIWVVKSVSKDPELVAKLHEQCITEVVCDMLLEYDPINIRRKAFGALCNMISGHRPGMAFISEDVLQAVTRCVVQSMHPLVVLPQPNANKSLSRGLSVLEAIASLSSFGKSIMCDEDDAEDLRAIPLTLQLLDSLFADVKLRALYVTLRWIEDNSDRVRVRQIMLAEPPLLSIVRAISEERGEGLLVALTLLNALLAIDEELKTKLASMTNEVLLRLLPTLVPTTNPSLSPMQLKALNEALKSLVTMTRSSSTNTPGYKVSTGEALSQNAAVENALDPLVELLRHSTASDNLRLNALYLLVNFAGSSVEMRPKLLLNGTMAACIRTLLEPHDDKLLQLCLLGMALLTSNGVDFSSVVPDLLEVVDVLLRCLVSKNASVQANAVWVVSNICGEEQLRTVIASRGGATTLQSILNEIANVGVPRGSSLSNPEQSRPLSSSHRIREYAPKAIKSLGFTPMTPGS